MACAKNLEGNIELSISFGKYKMYDCDAQRSDYENWIPFALRIILPERCCEIDIEDGATVTVYEAKKLIYELENIVKALESEEKYVYEYCNSESYFELNLEVLPDEEVIEVELWINRGLQSKGEIFGYDEGFRFILNRHEMCRFYRDIRNEIISIIG